MGRRRRSNLPPGLATLIGAAIIFAAAASVSEFPKAYYALLGLSALVGLIALYQYIKRNG